MSNIEIDPITGKRFKIVNMNDSNQLNVKPRTRLDSKAKVPALTKRSTGKNEIIEVIKVKSGQNKTDNTDTDTGTDTDIDSDKNYSEKTKKVNLLESSDGDTNDESSSQD